MTMSLREIAAQANVRPANEGVSTAGAKILVTGAAGFIGMHVARLLLERGEEVTGVDNLNDYYDPALKSARLAVLEKYPNFRFFKADIADQQLMDSLFAA